MAKVTKAPAPNPADVAESIAALLREKVTSWAKVESNPLQDLSSARSQIRVSTGFWPTVLTLSPVAFEDIIHHPDCLAFIAQVQVERTYDVRSPQYASSALAPLLGVKTLYVDVDEPSASLS